MYIAIAVLQEFRDELKDGREFQKAVIIITHAIRFVSSMSVPCDILVIFIYSHSFLQHSG
jgi:ABC-type Na+ transport system ATPase subunit NatA